MVKRLDPAAYRTTTTIYVGPKSTGPNGCPHTDFPCPCWKPWLEPGTVTLGLSQAFLRWALKHNVIERITS